MRTLCVTREHFTSWASDDAKKVFEMSSPPELHYGTPPACSTTIEPSRFRSILLAEYF